MRGKAGRHERVEHPGTIGGLIEVALSLLDFADGNPAIEPNGDEDDGSGAEDEEGAHTYYASGPGCEISDPGGCEHDGREHEEGH